MSVMGGVDFYPGDWQASLFIGWLSEVLGAASSNLNVLWFHYGSGALVPFVRQNLGNRGRVDANGGASLVRDPRYGPVSVKPCSVPLPHTRAFTPVDRRENIPWQCPASWILVNEKLHSNRKDRG